ncbi:MAG: BrnA antitoxin family protein [Candidatus Cloacimonetes bacterium]|nr:BrnA antitoxin family protein [Candidatus Cloacimonadota bacterium]
MKKKNIPKFKNEDEEREFWSKNDSTEYIDYTKAKKAIFPNIKPTTHAISIRIPDYLLNRLKMLAHKKDVPYQSLLKVYLTEKVEEEIKGVDR